MLAIWSIDIPLNYRRRIRSGVSLPKFIASKLRCINVSEPVTKHHTRHVLIMPKYLKSGCYEHDRIGSRGSGRRFLQSRVPSSVLARHYLNLTAIADRKYEKFARWLKYLLQDFILCPTPASSMYLGSQEVRKE